MSSPNDGSSLCCLVCSGPSNGICHFGVQCCRACASFFHRSIKQRRKYACRWGQQCQISNDQGLRNSCRACRLKKCLEMGMAEEKKRERKVPSSSSIISDSSISVKHSPSPALQQPQNCFIPLGPFQQLLSPSISLQNEQPQQQQISTALSLTAHLDDSLRQYENGLRAFSVVEGISTELAEQKEARLITHQEFLKADKAATLLIYAMLCQHLPLLRELSVEFRIKMLKTFSKQFILLHRIQMTCLSIPDPGSPLALIVPGGLIDRNRLDELFAEISDLERREKGSISIIERHFEFGKKRFLPLQISQLEFAALTGILFWNTVESCLQPAIQFAQIQAPRDAFYAELFALISSRMPPQQSAIRFANLLEMLHLLNLHTLEVDEMQTMAKIFMDLPDFWDEISLPA